MVIFFKLISTKYMVGFKKYLDEIMDKNILVTLKKHSLKIKELEKTLINDILAYCKNYPLEKICKHKYIIEYKENPWRLHDNVDSILAEL